MKPMRKNGKDNKLLLVIMNQRQAVKYRQKLRLTSSCIITTQYTSHSHKMICHQTHHVASITDIMQRDFDQSNIFSQTDDGALYQPKTCQNSLPQMITAITGH